MPTAPDPQEPRAPAAARHRADACPGALRLHSADDGALARIRIPGGVLTAAQATALGAAAERLGDGAIHLTSRGNAQLRGLDATCGAELERLLTAAGLLPSPAHERVRNIVASPLSGLDTCGHLDVRGWLRELDGLLCGDADARALSGRFLFALDDGRGDVAALGADVTVRATADGAALLGLGRNAPVRVPATAAPRAALLAAVRFLAAATPGGAPATAWRVAELPDGGAALAAEVAELLARSGVPVSPPGAPEAGGTRARAPEPGIIVGLRVGPTSADVARTAMPTQARAPEPGIVAGPGGTAALSVLAPLGRLAAAPWQALTALAARTGAAELRLTPWRGVVVPGVQAAHAREELAALAAAGLVTDARSPWFGVGACTGRPGCAKALADVRADAAALADLPHDDGPAALPVYWSGCERACGRPRGDHVDVVATPGGYRVDVVRDGAVRTGAAPDPADPTDLAATVAAARRGAVSR